MPQDCATSFSPLESALWGINQQGRKAVFKVIAVCGGSARLASWFSPEGFPGSGVACDDGWKHFGVAFAEGGQGLSGAAHL